MTLKILKLNGPGPEPSVHQVKVKVFIRGPKSSTKSGAKASFNSRQRYTGSGSLSVGYRRQVGFPGIKNRFRDPFQKVGLMKTLSQSPG